MELSGRAIQHVIHPTAACSSTDDFDPQEPPSTPSSTTSWDESLLNPKNRIDSLELPRYPLFRVDGCTGLGTQFYIVPLFFPAVPPVRADVFIPETQPAILREQLDLDVAFHTKDAARLSHLGISRYVVRALHYWVKAEFEDLAAFEKYYRTIPFGSRLVIDNLSFDMQKSTIRVFTNHNLERQLLSLTALTQLWGADFPFPQAIDFYEVEVIKILHDSVCLARIRGDLFIFKALTSGAKYLYHELKTLCTLGSHPNVIARPIHVVTKMCSFGGKRAVTGFTTFFHPNGSLRDILPLLRIHNQLERAQQFKWAIQLTAALEHLRFTSRTYYPDLRLDNIVLSESWEIVMVDFEQRGVWCEFAAPEVNALEYIYLVATEEDADPEIRERYTDILKQFVPNFEALEKMEYTNPPDGYNVPWLALSCEEQEAAEVYMLGRVLWCIFEGVSGPQRAAVWQSYPWESHLEFPQFSRTPPEMRGLIERCTHGRRDTLSSIVTRSGSRLVIKGLDPQTYGPREVREAAQNFWEKELEAAREFLAMRAERKQQGTWEGNHYGRPSLKDVLAELKKYQGLTSRDT
ncbi:hypothetical protein JX265_005537 [Neoarthrinium moseri]|uniref:Protein kinase domain-containing protein n=1 Tax=Neoarthrinium moseri TaxID=1658444 RepID=A0A9P9WPH1_9PEZI|nr:uncharacterized protein JN550_010265 [Neoarthrinium moseri]KAI1847402.1 hypothetical protein JX266_006627 [Neoarthrinium moseri]KAI1862258.1 hypothetical protein JN550_010265 [Neoarthrinium moseri]KAI1872657.1 hypothetical protein JX265_005537 [Neoarthrinium moseri]